MGGRMFWPGSGCEFPLFSISFSPDFSSFSLGNVSRSENQVGSGRRNREGGCSDVLFGVSFRRMKSQGRASTFYIPINIFNIFLSSLFLLRLFQQNYFYQERSEIIIKTIQTNRIKLRSKFKSHIVQAKKIYWTMNYIQIFIVTKTK